MNMIMIEAVVNYDSVSEKVNNYKYYALIYISDISHHVSLTVHFQN